MADVRGDGVNDLVVVTPAAVAVLDGMTGTLSVLLIDADGDGRRELFLFNPDGTLAR
jgi:hypothetical protein